MVMEPNSFLQGSRGSTSLPAGWRAMGAAQVSARSALCSPACGLFQIKPKRLRELLLPWEVTQLPWAQLRVQQGLLSVPHTQQ